MSNCEAIVAYSVTVTSPNGDTPFSGKVSGAETSVEMVALAVYTNYSIQVNAINNDNLESSTEMSYLTKGTR